MISVIYLKFVIVFYLAILLFFVIREGVKEQRKFPERAQNMQKLSPIFLLLNALRDQMCVTGLTYTPLRGPCVKKGKSEQGM